MKGANDYVDKVDGKGMGNSTRTRIQEQSGAEHTDILFGVLLVMRTVNAW